MIENLSGMEEMCGSIATDEKKLKANGGLNYFQAFCLNYFRVGIAATDDATAAKYAALVIQ